MKDKITIKIETRSNLLIGGAPTSFEIGGIDQYTVTDWEGYPYIPASSLKGTLRMIIGEDRSLEAERIKELYNDYLNKIKQENMEYIRKHTEKDAQDRIEKNYKNALDKKNISAEYLFGIKGFNNTPKLLFSDLSLCDAQRDKKKCFSVDVKNKLVKTETELKSTPRRYQAARSNLVFEGQIRLHQMEILGDNAVDLCRDFVIANLKKFNEGIYRLGNSKSRGYGKIGVEITESEATE